MIMPDNNNCSNPTATWLCSKNAGTGHPHIICPMEKYIKTIKKTKEQNSLFIVGHSLDVSDGDILTIIFDMFNVIVIYFRDDNSLDKYVKNLKLIFGAKELSKMTFSQKVIFRKLPSNKFDKVNTNDQL